MLISQFGGLEVVGFVNRKGLGSIAGVDLPWHRWPRFFRCFLISWGLRLVVDYPRKTGLETDFY